MSISVLPTRTGETRKTYRWNIEYLGVGRLANNRMLKAFAMLRTDGCTVTYRETTRNLTKITYHDLTITGPVEPINDFIDWLEDTFDRQAARRAARR